MKEEDFIKKFEYLKHLYDEENTKGIHEVLIHSKVQLYDNFNQLEGSRFHPSYQINLLVNPEIYKKHQKVIENYCRSIKVKLNSILKVAVKSVNADPDLSKFRILENKFETIITPWDEINNLQNNLIEQLRTSNNHMEFQNVGNTCRTIMQSISNIVFDSNIHKAEASLGIDLDEGKFKNRLETYIRCELDKKEDEIKKYAISAIETTKNSIDLANILTHKLTAHQAFAEACVISTLSSINIIKLIENMKANK